MPITRLHEGASQFLLMEQNVANSLAVAKRAFVAGRRKAAASGQAGSGGVNAPPDTGVREV